MEAQRIIIVLGGKWGGHYDLSHCPAPLNTQTLYLSFIYGLFHKVVASRSALLISRVLGLIRFLILHHLPIAADGKNVDLASSLKVAMRGNARGRAVSIFPVPQGLGWDDISTMKGAGL